MRAVKVLMAAGVAAAGFGWAYGAAAQSGGFEPAPGYTEPGVFGDEEERERVHPFGTLEEFGYTIENQPLNEIAGQRRRSERGVVGDALNAFKNGLLGRD